MALKKGIQKGGGICKTERVGVPVSEEGCREKHLVPGIKGFNPGRRRSSRLSQSKKKKKA